MLFAGKLLHFASHSLLVDAERDLKLSKALFSYKQVVSLSRGLKIARLHKRIVSGRVTLLPGTELWPVNFNKRRQQNEKAFFQKHSWRTHVSPMFPSFPHGKHFQGHFLFSRCKLSYTLHGREFQRKSEHVSTCKNSASTSNRALI